MTSLIAIGRRVTMSWKVALRAAVVKAQAALFLAALLLPVTAWRGLDDARSFGGVAVFPSDLIVLAALASVVALWYLSPEGERPRMLGTPVLSWPLLAFALLLIPGIVRGHERYGASLISQPVRLVFYAGIAAAMTELNPRQTFRWITVGLYAGAAWEAILAAYYIASGTSQTVVDVLSTGGTRVLSLTTGMFLATALVAAAVNIELEPRTRIRLVHALFGAIAAGGMLLSYARTTFLALAVVLVFLAWKLPTVRRAAIRGWRWWAPALVVLVAAVAVLAPSTATQVVDRVKANPLTDQSVRWRLAGIHAVLAGMGNGEWDTRSGLLTADTSGNHLVNASFEHGTTGWLVQGGSIFTVPTNIPGFGSRSLMLKTTGLGPDEGLYSSPVVAKTGQTWLSTAWLQGRLGTEEVNLSIWEYNDREQVIDRAEFPVALTRIPTQFAVKTTITDPSVTHIRVLVRTTATQKAVVYADLATLRLVTSPSAAQTRGLTTFNSDGAVLSPTITPEGFKFGDNQANYPVSGLNRLTNASFEKANQLGGMQGGTLSQTGAFSPTLGHSSALMTTDGKVADEGWYSEPVRVEPGQKWSFSILLQGKGREKLLVGIWLYERELAGTPVANLDLSATLAGRPGEYVVTGVVPPGRARYARAVVRTRDTPQKVSVLMDGAQMFPQQPNQPSPFSSQPSGASFQIDEPLLGLGFGRETQYVWEGVYYRAKGDPDNSYVFLLAGGGILALGGFLFLLGSYVRDAFRRLRAAVGIDRGLLLWAVSAWFILAANLAMAPFLPRPKIVLSFWALMLVPALVRRIKDERGE